MTLSPKVWGDVLRLLQDKIPDFAFDAWIAPLAVRIVRDERSVILGCPTSFHRDRVRVNYGELIRDCWTSACNANEAESGGDQRQAATIEFLTMKEFASARGTAIEVRLPDRREAAHHGSMRKIVSGALTAQLAHAEGSRGAEPRIGGSRPTPIANGGEPSASALRRAPSVLHAVPEQMRRKPSSGASKQSGDGAREMRVPSRGVEQSKDFDLKFRDPGQDATQPELPFSFESFIVGPCNALAREATLALARRRQQSLNQVYLGGGSGMGKTHLARAAAVEARLHAHGQQHYAHHAHHAHHAPSGEALRPASPSARREQAPRVIYTSAEQFTSEFVSAMRRGQPEEWKRRFRGPIGMLIVEDVQFFSGRAKTQLELFHTVQHVLDAGGSVLLTGDRAPRDLVGLDERMRAQVGRGFVAELELPDALVRRHILRAKAAGGGVHLSAECLDLLVESTAGSVRDVESMLIQVVTTSSLLGRKIDLELVQEAVALKAGDSGRLDSKTLETEEIVRIVASFFGKPAEALAGRSRRRDVLIPRQLAMYLAHRYTDASFTEIGRCLGRDHPSVRNAITRIERLVLEKAPLRYQIESISERIDRAVKDRD